MKNKRIAVLMGGMSTERPISFKSGKAVLGALRARGYDAVGIDVGPDLPEKLRAEAIDVAWVALHGQFGEDGCVQGLLEIMRIPYTGSGVRPSAAAMDKVTTKRLLADSGIALPADTVWRRGEAIPEEVELPLVAKFPEGGSTLGLHIVHERAALREALEDLSQMGKEVLLEQYIEGDEITVAVLDGEALPVVGIVPTSGFFDFEAKYTQGTTSYEVPATTVDADIQERAREHAALAYRTLGLEGIARADFIVDGDGTPWFLEINTIPGMTATSLSPMAASCVAVSFEDLVERLLLSARLHVQVHQQA